jgi:hypothetical protein
MSVTSASYDAWRLLSGGKFNPSLTVAIFPHEVNRSDGKPGAKYSRFLGGAEYCRRRPIIFTEICCRSRHEGVSTAV